MTYLRFRFFFISPHKSLSSFKFLKTMGDTLLQFSSLMFARISKILSTMSRYLKHSIPENHTLTFLAKILKGKNKSSVKGLFFYFSF